MRNEDAKEAYQTYVFKVIQRVKDTEDIKTVLNSLLGEVVDGIVTVGTFQHNGHNGRIKKSLTGS